MYTTNNSAHSGAICALVIIAVLVLGCGRFLGPKNGVTSGKSSTSPEPRPFDPNAPLPSGGAMALRQLADLEPSVAPLIDSVEAAERSAMKKVVAKARLGSGDDTDRSATSAPLPRTAKSSTSGNPIASAIMFQGGEVDEGNKRADAAALLGVVISFLGDIYGKLPLEKMENGFKPVIPRETVDGVTSDTKLEVSRGKDGATVTLLGIKSEGIKNGMQFKTEMTGKIDGQRCPNAEGQVSFSMKLRLNVEADGSVYSQDLTAFVRAVVNDNARRASQTIDVIQGTRHVKGGRELYIETGQTVSREGTAANSVSNYREIRTSSQTKPSDVKISEDGLTAAYNFGEGSLAAAEATWLGGGCTAIEAKSPGTVATNSTTAIPVVVRHKFEGTEIASKLDVVLKGEKSIDPTSIAKTAGTLTYVAPGDTNKSATISLTATSRRGRAKLDLNANTGGASYQIVGGLDDWQTNSKVCDIMKPFTLTGTHGIKMELTGGLSGTYSYSGQFNTQGTGTYTITLPGGVGKPGTMTGSGEGSAEGHSNSGTEKYTLTPIEPCS